jgi:hypothetical protein
MREDASGKYLSYKLIDSNQDWKERWFYIINHHPKLPKPSGRQLKHPPWWNTKPTMSYGHPWAHNFNGCQDRLLGGPLELLDLCYTAPDGVECKDCGGGVLG